MQAPPTTKSPIWTTMTQPPALSFSPHCPASETASSPVAGASLPDGGLADESCAWIGERKNENTIARKTRDSFGLEIGVGKGGRGATKRVGARASGQVLGDDVLTIGTLHYARIRRASAASVLI